MGFGYYVAETALGRPLPGPLMGLARLRARCYWRSHGRGDGLRRSRHRALHLVPALDRKPLLLPRRPACRGRVLDLVRTDDRGHGRLEARQSRQTVPLAMFATVGNAVLWLWTIVKRLSAPVLAVALVVALTAQAILLAHAMPINSTAMSAVGMSGHPDGQPVAPCKHAGPICVEHVGCLTALAIPASPAATGVPVQWGTVRYNLAVSHLTGQSVEPELSPPILAI